MGTRTVIPFGPQHPVLPEPIHLDLVLEDEKVVEAVPQLGFIHRGLEKLVEKRDFQQFIYIAERICGICSFGHSYGYAQGIEGLMGIEVPPRAEYLRAIFNELSRVHSHLLWLGLLADAFGYENLFQQCWRLRETVLDMFERTTGGRVILSACCVGGMSVDVEDGVLAGICTELETLESDYRRVCKAFLGDGSVNNRLKGIGLLSKEDAIAFSTVGPFARASGVDYDTRTLGFGAYGDLAAFEPVTSDEGDGYARVDVRIREVIQSIQIVRELVSKMPAGEIAVKVKGAPAEGSRFVTRMEQPRGCAVYLMKGNGTKFLERFRVRTPTSQNIAGLVHIMAGCDLADVPLNVLTIDPCISCTER